MESLFPGHHAWMTDANVHPPTHQKVESTILACASALARGTSHAEWKARVSSTGELVPRLALHSFSAICTPSGQLQSFLNESEAGRLKVVLAPCDRAGPFTVLKHSLCAHTGFETGRYV